MRVVKPKKFLGQHFLKDLKVAQDIADTVDVCPEIPILEVGPGMGVLTQFLLPKERNVKVVELDYESVAYLREAYPQLEDNIIEDDFLKMNLQRLFGGQPFVLTGNYPYNISSQIFFKMLEYKDLIPCCTGMIQKEVAERIAAGPGSKTYGILSVLIQAWYKVEYLFTVHEHVFNPPPKVKSAVICMMRNETHDLGCDEKLFKQVVKTTFNQRRKTLRNSIKPILSKTYGILSVLIQAWYKVEYLFTVHEHVFNPPPKVKSAVICMMRNETHDLGCDEKLFKQVVKTTFNQRRKTLRNSIKPILGKDCPLTEDVLFNKRPEQLSVQEFIQLTNQVEQALRTIND